MFGWFNYWHYDDLIKIIDKVTEDRQKRRLHGKTMKSKFSEDLKDYLNGIWVEEKDDEKAVINQVTKKVTENPENEENIRMYIENQFGNE